MSETLAPAHLLVGCSVSCNLVTCSLRLEIRFIRSGLGVVMVLTDVGGSLEVNIASAWMASLLRSVFCVGERMALIKGGSW